VNYILGVDPGLSGALAVFDPTNFKCVDIIDMPIIVDRRTGKNEIDLFGLAVFVDSVKNSIDFAIIEKVGSMPNQGLSSTFKFGLVTGIVKGVMAANYLPQSSVVASVWKSDMNLSHDKSKSVLLARKLFPDWEASFTKSKDGRAEALLLAVFASKHKAKLK
jgi:crossover junction endodeoxyribonuclease RuvC